MGCGATLEPEQRSKSVSADPVAGTWLYITQLIYCIIPGLTWSACDSYPPRPAIYCVWVPKQMPGIKAISLIKELCACPIRKWSAYGWNSVLRIPRFPCWRLSDMVHRRFPVNGNAVPAVDDCLWQFTQDFVHMRLRDNGTGAAKVSYLGS